MMTWPELWSYLRVMVLGVRGSWVLLCLGLGAFGCSSDDAGEDAPAKPLETTLACTDSPDSVWATPVTAGDRGEVLGCAELGPLDASEVATRLQAVPEADVAGGVRRFLIAYRTERDKGEPGVGSALVYLPEKPRRGALPAVVGAHGTTGLADACAPSHSSDHPYLDSLVVSWAAAGLPVIAPDYAGLGTAGVQGYANFPDTGRSVLDSARALRRLVGSDRVSEQSIFFGHSQGGGAALAAAAYSNETPDVKVSAIVSFAGVWVYLSFVEALRLTSVSMKGLRGAVATTLYADLANIADDESQAGAAFHPSIRPFVTEKTGTLCYPELVPALDAATTGYVPPATMGEFVDPDFRTGVLDCADDGKCAGLPGKWAQRQKENDPHVDPSVPILYLAGDADTELKPSQASCFFGRLVDDGAAPVECVYPGEDHQGIVPNSTGFAIDWATAAVRGAAPPACPADGALPNCSLF
ncbi:MAG: alpha/beta fold hydrolase [Polyangiaceae bacterium]|nr:alpha/beta fold hydrolase [Polyangiaceae bacterium]